MKFKLDAPFKPAGGQPEAIKKLVDGFSNKSKQTLLGITGSGKTFVCAQVIEQTQKKTLVLAHNKILAAQLYQEFKELFPENKVEYFISYFDYYQPESYLPTTDTYIEKDSSVNEQISKMRLSTMASLSGSDDVIVVASISCIYGAGDPGEFKKLAVNVKIGDKKNRKQIIQDLVKIQYERNNTSLESGKFRVRGDVIDVWPSYSDKVIRIELFGNEVERITQRHNVTGEVISKQTQITIFPAKAYVAPDDKQEKAIIEIKEELEETLPSLSDLEAHRLKKRVEYDIEMIEEMGYCSGIENYSRHFENRKKGEPPFCLLDYFGDDFLLIIDESHQTLPQSRAMYKGDYSRKKNLVDFGFRLPCAFDNRPLKFEEFERFFGNTLFVSATPAEYELSNSDQVVELIIRPTGLIDPTVEVRPIDGHIKDLVIEINKTVANKERVLVTTITKKMAEDLTEYLSKQGIKVRYMHSEIESLDRIELIRGLRAGEFDVLVGINLLREGLDIPEVSLVCMLDADKEGFLRDERSFIQTIGRAARNDHGRVILYANRMTGSMQRAIDITKKRRIDQQLFNKKNGIVPKTVIKKILEKSREVKGTKHMSASDVAKKIIETQADMRKAAENLDFERAIALRDHLGDLERGG
jgi:excinuclease ABC subunit B